MVTGSAYSQPARVRSYAQPQGSSEPSQISKASSAASMADQPPAAKSAHAARAVQWRQNLLVSATCPAPAACWISTSGRLSEVCADKGSVPAHSTASSGQVCSAPSSQCERMLHCMLSQCQGCSQGCCSRRALLSMTQGQQEQQQHMVPGRDQAAATAATCSSGLTRSSASRRGGGAAAPWS